MGGLLLRQERRELPPPPLADDLIPSFATLGRWLRTILAALYETALTLNLL